MSQLVFRAPSLHDLPAPAHARRLTSFTPSFIVVVLAILLATQSGGYAPVDWYPAAIFALLLCGITASASARMWSVWPRAFRLSVLAFGGLTLWSYASISWADVPSDAWHGANRTLLYWLTFVTVGWRAWNTRASNMLLAWVLVGVVAIAIGVLLVGVLGSAPERLFVEGRLSEPVGYSNATATLFLLGLWPALHFALSPASPLPVRAGSLAAATLLLQIALLTQSRGAAIVLAVVTLVFVCLTPRRWGALGALVLLAAATGSSWDVLTAIHVAQDEAALSAAFDAAALRVVVNACAVLVVTALAVVFGRRLWPPERRPATVIRAGNFVLAASAVATALLAFGSLAGNQDWVDARWRDFKQAGYTGLERGPTRFTGSLGSGRYDYYRVALDEFREHPLRGIGTENFAVPYLIERRTAEAPVHPHSLAFRVLVQLGVVGAVLLATLLGALAWAFIRRRRGKDPEDNAAAVAALCGGLSWLGHAMGDWLWAVPAISMLGLALLALVAHSTESAHDEPSWVQPRTQDRRIGARVAVITVAVVLAVASLVPPWLSARYEAAGREQLETDPGAAFAAFRRAADLNPLNADPTVAAGLVARELEQRRLARALLRDAVSREPASWFANFELGLLDAEDGQRGAALRRLETAQRLNPQLELIPTLRQRVRRRQPIDAAAVERELFSQVEVRLTPTQ